MGASLEELAGDERMLAAIQAGHGTPPRPSRVEQVKKFMLLPGDWLPAGDELTPKRKLRRRPIVDKYVTDTEAMYAR